MEVRDKAGAENVIGDRLSRLPVLHINRASENTLINESFPDERLCPVDLEEETQCEEVLSVSEVPWYADLINYIVCKELPRGLRGYLRKKFLHNIKQYFWNEPYLFKQGTDLLF